MAIPRPNLFAVVGPERFANLAAARLVDDTVVVICEQHVEFISVATPVVDTGCTDAIIEKVCSAINQVSPMPNGYEVAISRRATGGDASTMPRVYWADEKLHGLGVAEDIEELLSGRVQWEAEYFPGRALRLQADLQAELSVIEGIPSEHWQLFGVTTDFIWASIAKEISFRQNEMGDPPSSALVLIEEVHRSPLLDQKTLIPSDRLLSISEGVWNCVKRYRADWRVPVERL